MALFSIFDIVGSGLSAQNTRLNTTASNISNADSVASSAKDAYKARQPIFSAMVKDAMQQSSGAVGVKTLGIVESQAENTRLYQPNNPLADNEGYVYQSNVNTIEEMTNMISASRNYQNNIEVLSTSKELILRTLRLGE